MTRLYVTTCSMLHILLILALIPFAAIGAGMVVMAALGILGVILTPLRWLIVSARWCALNRRAVVRHLVLSDGKTWTRPPREARYLMWTAGGSVALFFVLFGHWR